MMYSVFRPAVSFDLPAGAADITGTHAPQHGRTFRYYYMHCVAYALAVVNAQWESAGGWSTVGDPMKSVS